MQGKFKTAFYVTFRAGISGPPAQYSTPILDVIQERYLTQSRSGSIFRRSSESGRLRCLIVCPPQVGSEKKKLANEGLLPGYCDTYSHS